MGVDEVLEPALVGSALAAYCLYHVYLWMRYRRNPMSTTIGHNHEARLRWCDVIMRERNGILGVQTIRNTPMSSSLLASTSLTLTAVVAAYLVGTVEREGAGGIDIPSAPYLRPIHKFFGVILAFSISFYCYMQSVRASNHAGYLLGIPLGDEHHFTPHYVARVISRGTDFHTAGTRVFYLVFVFVLWILDHYHPSL